MLIWRVNVSDRKISREPIPGSWERLGGRGLVARILVDEVPPACEPLGPRNKLIFAPGLLVGHMLSSCDRISIGGKSPLTGGVKEANAGGTTGFQMALLGMKALIIEDWPADPGLSILYLSASEARFDPGGEFTGLGVYESASRLIERYGRRVAIALIGPGGEMKLASAGIQNLDKEDIPSRIAARGGLGALMASKGLKAIVFDGRDGVKPPINDTELYRAAQKVYNQAVLNHPQTHVYRDYGTAAMAAMCDGLGALPTRNFSTGTFEHVESIGGDALRELLGSRGRASDPTHACMPGCTIRCSNVFGDENGKVVVSPLEYETIGLMGSNLGIDNLDIIARMNWQVNDLGLDSIEIGAALGVAAEAGLMDWGDGFRALELIAEIRDGSPLGRVLGNGVTLTGKVLAIENVPAVKGQAMSAYDPRAIKGTGVTYATSPQGADHTSGLTIRDPIDHLSPAGQAVASRAKQITMAGYDSLGACIFSGFGFAAAPQDTIQKLLHARYGWDIDNDILQRLGKETLSLEREFNLRAGFSKEHDRLPEWMTRKPLPPHNCVFDVPDEDLDSMFDW
ncbi:MAG: aldehyde ferredoxin oxidoreductase C-terminal domain-containing protein [Chloroflexota bacterium]